MFSSTLKASLLLITGFAALQCTAVLADSVKFQGGSFEIKPAAGGFILDRVVNNTGQVVNNLHLEIEYTNLMGERRVKQKSFKLQNLKHGQSFTPPAWLGVTILYGSDGLPSIDNASYDASKSYWGNSSNQGRLR